MTIFHKDLTIERWQKLSLFEQMANVGAEVGRAINWIKSDKDRGQSALFRGLELLDLTIEDTKNKKRLKELLLVRECLVDYFLFKNDYRSSNENWNNYFYAFNYAARLNK